MVENNNRPSTDYRGGQEPIDSADDSLSLGDFITAIRNRSRIVWGTILLGLLIGCVYMVVVKPLYTITMVVAPAPSSTVKTSTSGALSSLTTGASALSGILGTTSAPAQLAPMDEFMQLIISPRVAQEIIGKDKNVLPMVFPTQWDAQKKEWHPAPGIFSLIHQGFYGLFGMQGWAKPSPQSLATYLEQNLTITPVGTTAMQELSLNFRSPEFGVALFNHLHDVGDSIVRQEAQTLADKQIDYLQKKLATTQEIDYRQTLLGLLANQVINRMSINSSLPYAATVIQVPIATDLPTSPSPFIVLPIALVLGFLLGVFFALLAALIWPAGMPRKITYGAGRVAPAFRKALEYFLTVPENVRSNAN